MKPWQPEQCLAAIVIVGCMILIALKIDGEVKGVLALSVGWLFRATIANQQDTRYK